MAGQRRTWSTTFAIVSLLLVWEILYYLELIDQVRFSHPVGIVKILAEERFLLAFINILVLLVFASLPGGVIGVALGSLIIRSSLLSHGALRFLRIGLWIPFLIYWPLPIRSVLQGKGSAPIFWLWIISVVTVALSACYHYLAARFTLGLEWHKARPQVARAAILQGLFISLLFQLSIWNLDWFFYPGSKEVPIGYTALILLVAFLFFLDWVFGANFDDAAEVRGTIVLRELKNKSWGSLYGAALFAIVCLVLLLLLIGVGFYPHIRPPLEIFKTSYRLLTSGIGEAQEGETLWRDMGVSLLEVFGGLILGGVAAFIVSRGLSNKVASVRSLLPLTCVVPIVLLPAWIGWAGLITFKWTTLGVAFLSFFPIVQALWGLRDRPLFCQILLAADEALPFAFIAMVFGEAMNAIAGLGFSMVVASTKLQITEALAICLITVALLVILSSSLRWSAKRLYFPQALAGQGSLPA